MFNIQSLTYVKNAFEINIIIFFVFKYNHLPTRTLFFFFMYTLINYFIGYRAEFIQ